MSRALATPNCDVVPPIPAFTYSNLAFGNVLTHHFLYRRNGAGTPGHIRIPEAEEMAEELAGYIEKSCLEKGINNE